MEIGRVLCCSLKRIYAHWGIRWNRLAAGVDRERESLKLYAKAEGTVPVYSIYRTVPYRYLRYGLFTYGTTTLCTTKL